MDNTTTRLITFLWGSASNQEWTLPEHEVFPEQTLELIRTCWWWPSAFTWKKSASQNTQDSSLTLKSWKIPMCWKHFQVMIGGKFAPHIIMNNEDTCMDSMIITFNTAQQWLKQPVKSLAHIIRGKKRESLQKFWTWATKGENWERTDSNLKDLRNSRKWTTTSKGARKRLKNTG